MDFELVDAKNASNEMNQSRMLWMVRYLWTSGARFVFNCYFHYSLLVPRTGDWTANIIHIRDGAIQGGPLAMVAYGIEVLPLGLPGR